MNQISQQSQSGVDEDETDIFNYNIQQIQTTRQSGDRISQMNKVQKRSSMLDYQGETKQISQGSSTRLLLASTYKLREVKVNESVLENMKRNRRTQRSNDDIQPVVNNVNVESATESGFNFGMVPRGQKGQNEQTLGDLKSDESKLFVYQKAVTDHKIDVNVISPISGASDSSRKKTEMTPLSNIIARGSQKMRQFKPIERTTKVEFNQTQQPLAFKQVKDGQVDISTNIFPPRDTKIHNASPSVENKLFINKDKFENPMDVKKFIDSQDFSGVISDLNKQIFGSATPHMNSEFAKLLKTQTPESVDNFSFIKSKDNSMSPRQQAASLMQTPGSVKQSPSKSPQKNETDKSELQIVETKSHFTTKGLGLVNQDYSQFALVKQQDYKPTTDQSQYLNKSYSTAMGYGQETDPTEQNSSMAQMETQKGFGVDNKNFSTMVVMNKQPLNVQKSPGKLKLQKEYLLTHGHSKIFNQTPEDFKQKKGQMNYQTSRNIFSDNSQTQFFSSVNLSDQNSKIVKRLVASKHDEIQKKKKENLEKFHMPKEFLSRHPKYLKEYRKICRETRMNDTLQINQELAVSRMPSMGQYQILTPSMTQETESQLDSETASMLNPNDRPLDRVKTDVSLNPDEFQRRKAELELISQQQQQFAVNSTIPQQRARAGRNHHERNHSYNLLLKSPGDSSKQYNQMLASNSISQNMTPVGMKTQIQSDQKIFDLRNHNSTQMNVTSRIFDKTDALKVVDKTIKNMSNKKQLQLKEKISKLKNFDTPQPERQTYSNFNNTFQRMPQYQQIHIASDAGSNSGDTVQNFMNTQRKEFVKQLEMEHAFGYTAAQVRRTNRVFSPEMINSESSRKQLNFQDNPPQTFTKPENEMIGRRAGYEILPLVDYKHVQKAQKTKAQMTKFTTASQKKNDMIKKFASISLPPTVQRRSPQETSPLPELQGPNRTKEVTWDIMSDARPDLDQSMRNTSASNFAGKMLDIIRPPKQPTDYKHCISMTAQEMIKKLDEIIKKKKGALTDPFKGVEQSKHASRETSKLTDYKKGAKDTKGSMLSLVSSDLKTEVEVSNFARTPTLYMRKEDTAPKFQRQKLVRQTLTSKQAKEIPKIVSEVLREEKEKTLGPIGKQMQKHINGQKCTCGVNELLKQLVRRLRGLDHKLPEYQAELRQQLKGGIEDLNNTQRSNFGTTQQSGGYMTNKSGKTTTSVADVAIMQKSVLNFNETIKSNMNQSHGKKKVKIIEQKQPLITPCVHDFEAEMDEEKRILVMQWFENFQDSLIFEDKKPRLKQKVLQKFIKFVLEECDLQIEGLRKFIQAFDLQKKLDIDYADFYKFNEYMSIMIKKNKKLNAEDLTKITFEDSLDSETDQDSDDADTRLLIHNPEHLTNKNQNVVLGEDENPLFAFNCNEFLDMISETSIKVSEKVYNNFISELCDVDDFEVFKIRKVDDDKDEQIVEMSKQVFEDSLNHSLKNVTNAIRDLIQQKMDYEKLKQKNKYNGKKMPVKQVDSRIADLKAHLDHDLDKKESKLRKQKDLFRDKRQAKANAKKMREEVEKKLKQDIASGVATGNVTPNNPIQLVSQTSSPVRGAPQRKMSKTNTMGVPIPEKVKKVKEVQIYTELEEKVKFYNEAKRLMDAPEDSKNTVITKYIRECKENDIIPQPHFLNLIQQNVLTIRGIHMSDEKTNALCNLLKSATVEKIKRFNVKKLIIDSESMDDNKISMILKSLEDQNFLRSICIMNTTIGQKSLDILQEFLYRKYPEEVEELKLINIKGLWKSDVDFEEILEIIRDQNSVSKIQLTNLELKRVDILNEILWTNSNLLRLDLSYCGLPLHLFKEVTEALIKNEMLEYLSLRNAVTLQLPSILQTDEITDEQQERLELSDGIVDDLAIFIANSHTLKHLDLSGLALGNLAIKLTKKGFIKSKSLLAIHLAQNDLGQLDIEEILETMGIDHTEIIAQLRRSLGNMEKEEIMCPGRGAPSSDVKKMVIAAQTSKKAVLPEPLQKTRMRFDDKGQSEVVNMVLTDVNKIREREQKQDLSTANHGESRIREKLYQARLVLQRKIGNADSIFNEKIQTQLFSKYKHFDLNNLEEPWQVRTRDEECYVCNDYVHHYVFFNSETARDDFEQITNTLSLQALNFHIKASGIMDDADPYKNLPIILGTIFDKDIQCARMINVQHQAMIIWALKEINDLRARNKPLQKDMAMKKYINIIQFLMKDCQDKKKPLNEQQMKDTKEEVNNLMQHFFNWRDYIIPDAFEENKQQQFMKVHKIINFPQYRPAPGATITPDPTSNQNNSGNNYNQTESKKPDTHDIDTFMFAGYIKPGMHNIIIYDPKTQKFYKRDNINVEPRDKTVKLGDRAGSMPIHLPDESILNEEDHESKAIFMYKQMKGPNFKTIQTHIWDDLLNDFSPKICQICFDSDLTEKVVEFPMYTDNHPKTSQLAMTLKENYFLILMVWKHIQLAEDPALKLYEMTKIDQRLWEDALALCHDTMATSYTGVNYDQTVKKEAKMSYLEFKSYYTEQARKRMDNPPDPQEMTKPDFQRRMLALAIARAAVMLDNKKPNNMLKDILRKFSSLIEPDLSNQLSQGIKVIYHNDLKWLRKKFLFQNKPLITILKLNKNAIRDQLFAKHLVVIRNPQKGFFEPNSLDLQPQIIPTKYFTLSESMPKFMEIIRKLYASDNYVSIPSVINLFHESKMSILMQEIENKHDQVLEFNEFLQFLTLLAIKLSEYGEITDEEKHEEQQKKQSPFVLGQFPAEKVKLTQMEIAINLQSLLIRIGDTYEENPFEELDLGPFKETNYTAENNFGSARSLVSMQSHTSKKSQPIVKENSETSDYSEGYND